MSPAILSLLTFLSIVMVSVSLMSVLSDLFLRDRDKVNQRLKEEFRKTQKEKIRKSSLFKDLQKVRLEDLGEGLMPKMTLRAKLEQLLEQSGLDWKVERFLITSAAVALALALPVLLIQRSILFAAIVAIGGAMLPNFYVRLKRTSRLNALRSQLPDAYGLMAQGMRAGQTLSMVMQGVSEEFPQPISGEFAYCYEQQNLGLPTELALRDLARRTSLMEVNIFVVAVVIQNQVGGNLAEILDNLAKIVRERTKMQGMINTLTAEGRYQAVLLVGLPPAMFLAMLIINPSYALILFDHPILIICMLISMSFGALWIRKIINFDF